MRGRWKGRGSRLVGSMNTLHGGCLLFDCSGDVICIVLGGILLFKLRFG